MSKPFASSADLEEKTETLEELGRGIYALTSEGDPNIGAIEAEDFVICFEARATPAAAADWVARVRELTGKPIRYLILSHYHAVRVLGASAFEAQIIVGHEATAHLIEERGQEDWESELARMPRLFKDPDTIPGLTWLDLSFSEALTIELGGSRGRLELHHCGRGHTAGDIVLWLPEQRVLFAGDLVEAEAALYTGDAFHTDWSTTTLDRVAAFGADALVGGRGPVVRGASACGDAIEQTRGFLLTMIQQVRSAREGGGTLADAFQAAHEALAPRYGAWPIFEHCLPFDVARVWDELEGIEWPRIWTQERDREVWDLLQQ